MFNHIFILLQSKLCTFTFFMDLCLRNSHKLGRFIVHIMNSVITFVFYNFYYYYLFSQLYVYYKCIKHF